MSFRHTFLYVTNIGTGNVEIFNLSTNAENPPSIRTFGEGFLSSPCGMAVDVNTLYIANAGGDQDIEVFDITNRGNPVRVGEFGGGDLSNPNALLLVGAFLYVTNLTSSTIEVYHTANNPQNPDKVTEFGAGQLNRPNGLAFVGSGVLGTILYVSNSEDATIEIYNISDPANPQHIGQFGGLTEISHPIGLMVFSNLLYVANFDGIHGNTIAIYDLADPLDPQFVGRFGAGLLSGPTEMTRNVELLYVVNENANNIEVFSLSPDPRNPVHIGEFSGNLSAPFGIFVVEPLAP